METQTAKPVVKAAPNLVDKAMGVGIGVTALTPIALGVFEYAPSIIYNASEIFADASSGNIGRALTSAAAVIVPVVLGAAVFERAYSTVSKGNALENGRVAVTQPELTPPA